MLPAVLSSKAWSEFLASEKVSAGSRKLLGDGLGRYTAGLKSVQVQPLSPAVGNEALTVTVNKFITNGTSLSSQDEIKRNIWALCRKGAPGTSFSQVTQQSDSIVADPMCYYCLSRGYGVDEDTPGFYLPCGCQRTCVDVSGNSVGSYDTRPATAAAGSFYGLGGQGSKAGEKGFPFLSNSFGSNGVYGKWVTGQSQPASYGQTMNTCQDYIDNGMVTTCNEIFIYHFVLWPSIFGSLALLYTAYSMVNMNLDMDSLLYTVGSGHKKND
jgi:hypothetical protein